MISEELIDLAERTEAQLNLIDKAVDIGKERDGIFRQGQWIGLPNKLDWTWESLSGLYTGVLDTVDTFLSSGTSKR